MTMDYLNDGDTTHFFFAGAEDIDDQIQSEVMQCLTTRKRSLFFWRDQGSGIPDYENLPVTAQQQIAMAYDSVMSITQRNATVPTGNQVGQPDMRVAVSQSSVTVTNDGKGNVGLTVLYIPLYSFKARKSPAIPLAGS